MAVAYSQLLGVTGRSRPAALRVARYLMMVLWESLKLSIVAAAVTRAGLSQVYVRNIHCRFFTSFFVAVNRGMDKRSSRPVAGGGVVVLIAHYRK